MSIVRELQFCRLVRFSLTTPDADRLAGFYESAFGFRRFARKHYSDSDFDAAIGVEGGAMSISVGLGLETIELLEFERQGLPYPNETAASDLVFQHFAIVTTNIGLAYRRLSEIGGWTAISLGGPQRLPEAAGGVTAFKLRDPDGHPLELLQFPESKMPSFWRNDADSLFLGIDHSAISVSDSARSIAFYKRLGLAVSSIQVNRGPEQGALDGLLTPHVAVTALVPRHCHPHLELLCYDLAGNNPRCILRNNDVAASRLVFEACDLAPDDGHPLAAWPLVDPDGHHILIVSRGRGPAEDTVQAA